MRQWLFFLSSLLVILLLVQSAMPIPTAVAQDGPNLLRNPGFEGEFFAWAGVPEAQVAHEWTPWWIEDTSRDPRWHRPEWKRAVAANFPKRVLSGASAQQYFTFFASHYAGMYQQVFDVTPGKRYRFGIWVQLWSSMEDNADTSVLPANPRLQIGIEPNGVALPGFAQPPGTVIWSGEAPMDQIVDRWGYMTVEATAGSDVITVYIRSRPDFANKHNDIYLDEASLVEIDAAPPTAVPPTITNTPEPEPTNEVTATLTATATTAVEATATATREPTTTSTATVAPTVEATATLEPTATATAEPSATPTATQEPTATSTVTPDPTSTNVPTATPDTTATAVVDANIEATEIAQANLPVLATNTPAASDAETTTEETSAGSLSSLLVGFLLGGGLIAALGGLFIWLRRR